MSSVPRPRLLSAEEYLARERAAMTRSEFYRGEMFAMAGATWAHTLIKDNMAYEARSQLRGGPCQVVTSDLRVKVSATGLYTYPDVLAVCEEPRFEDEVKDTLLNPCTIVEVLSVSTEKYDRGDKFTHYQRVPSIQEYVLIAQDRPFIERFVRQPDGSWLRTTFADNDTFVFASISVRIPLTEVYRGVVFPRANDNVGVGAP
jgi:Uma2 family endonuclease